MERVSISRNNLQSKNSCDHLINDDEWGRSNSNKENINTNNIISTANDTSVFNLNKSDINWGNNTSSLHTSHCRLRGDVANYRDELEIDDREDTDGRSKINSDRTDNMRISKFSFGKSRIVVDNTQMSEDAVKLEKLVGGYGKKKLSKLPTTSEFGESALENCKDRDEKEMEEEEKKEFHSQKSIKQLILNATEKKSDEIHYKEPAERILHKMISNTLGYYQLDNYYETDQIMKLFADHDLMKFCDAATNNSDLNELNSRIDLGEYPISRFINK